MYVNSEEVPLYNPILIFLNNLPQWDGQKIELGRALTSLDYERKDHSHVAYYKAVPLKVA